MASTGWLVLILLTQIQSHMHATSSAQTDVGNLSAPSGRCRREQARALLQLKQSFLFDESATTLASWRNGTDCCHWEGVGCDAFSGHVTVLNLSGRALYSYGLNSVVFDLTSLLHLDLSNNDFGGSRLPATGFERLSSLTHLNISNSGFCGQIPISIAYLNSLTSLDLSSNHDSDPIVSSWNKLSVWDPSFTTLVANFSNLRELYLDWVDIFSSGEEWCTALAKFVPQIQVVSLGNCWLRGAIHPSLSNLRSLTVINLQHNYDMFGPFPDFFADFPNLTVLQISYANLQGWFPHRMFQLKKLRVLDVSNNPKLSGHLSNFSNGSSLENLDTMYTNFSYAVPSCFRNFRSLKLLGLDARYISTELPSVISMLKSLNTLKLSYLSASTDLKSFSLQLGLLKNLTKLELHDFNYSSASSFWIGNLKNLMAFEIYGCTGPIPPGIRHIKKLRTLQLSNCNFGVIIPSWIGSLTDLTSLQLPSCSFVGEIPPWVKNLTQLVVLDLSKNRLNGGIPKLLFSLPALRVLFLQSNQLSGLLHDFYVPSSSLTDIDVSNNKFNGSIPKSLFQLTNLRSLNLRSNLLADLVELSSLSRLRYLWKLALSKNNLSVIDEEGTLSSPFFPKLRHLYLASCNLNKIPDSLRPLDHIVQLDLSYNHIQGSIPQWIWDNSKDTLIHVDLSHNMFSGLELSSPFIPASVLRTLYLSFNRLKGEITVPHRPGIRQLLDFSNNNFSSIVQNFSSRLTQTIYLNMTNNKLTGPIPQSICNASLLRVLDLSYNNFSGSIPSCLIDGGHVNILNLRGNHLEGRLPSKIKKGCVFQTIDIHGNEIEGPLPTLLSNCKDLEVIDLGENSIVDSLPSWLGKLPKLRVLVLRSNHFYGTIDDLIRDDKAGDYFSTLQIIDLASNNLSGNLPLDWFQRMKAMMANLNRTGVIIGGRFISTSNTGFYQNTVAITYKGSYMTFSRILTTLTAIDVSNNALDGGIPASIGKLVSLHVLNMSHNAITGAIPPELGGMNQLESLDLSRNQLSGEIPQQLTNLTFLGTLNLSSNQLVGRIPQSHQFTTFQNSSFEGNAGLCGPPLSKRCTGSNTPSDAAPSHVNKSSEHVDVVLFLFVGLGFGVGFAVAILTAFAFGETAKWFRSLTAL